jgi:hypothetical protein
MIGMVPQIRGMVVYVVNVGFVEIVSYLPKDRVGVMRMLALYRYYQTVQVEAFSRFCHGAGLAADMILLILPRRSTCSETRGSGQVRYLPVLECMNGQ